VATAYTPGLKVLSETVIRKDRLLPLDGEVLVKKSDTVKATDIVAETFLPGNVVTVNIANKLGVSPEDVPGAMKVAIGDKVTKGQIIAEMKSFFGLLSNKCDSPTDGTVENISNVTGQVILREAPMPVQVTSYIDGVVSEVYPRKGIQVETTATFVQGIFGIGREAHGELVLRAEGPDTVLEAAAIKPEDKGKILLGGSLVTAGALKKAMQVGVVGIVVGGFYDKDLRDFLGYDLGVAITGHEEGITLIVTEGFGKMRMADATFELLKSRCGMTASINGATQIRAGVIRPEIIIPLSGVKTNRDVDKEKESSPGLAVGSRIRAIREPYFGKLGEVVGLPPELRELETEAMVRVLEAKFDDGTMAVIPRANVELIET
jgi:biotin carboxyl carrier protein